MGAEKMCETDPEATPAAEWKPGRHILPPEVIEITKNALPRYASLIRYNDHAHQDCIGKGNQSLPKQHPPGAAEDNQAVYLYGDTSEVHRWGADLDEEDFFKQVEMLTRKNPKKGFFPVIIGVHRTNFFRLEKIVAFVLKKRQRSLFKLPVFDIRPLHNLSGRFLRYLDTLKQATRKVGISFMVADPELELLFQTTESCLRQNPERENDILRALGPVCKDVFIGPKYLLLDLSGQCNLNCTYCRRFSPWKKANRGGDSSTVRGFLNLASTENVLSEARDLGTETVLLVGGGEPTLHPHFGAIVTRIKELGMTFNMSTNGALIHHYTDQLLDPCCGTVTVSISAASERSFRAIRPGSAPRMLRGIESNVSQLSRMKKQRGQANPQIITLYALCRPNVHEILKMAIHSKRMGSDTVWYQMVHLEPFSRENLHIHPSELPKVKRQLLLVKILSKILGLNVSSFIDFEMDHFNGDKGDWSRKGLLHQGCYVGWHFAFVHIMQEVFMCCGPKVVGFLNASGSGFKSLWQSDAYRRYRNDGLIMHKENPITLYGFPLYDRYCDSCDNHDQNNMMIDYLRRFNLMQFVQR
jgi:MoaA/NifB/PqqE/SkfB family radical SAM enzyme